jgi:hypothetical protein
LLVTYHGGEGFRVRRKVVKRSRDRRHTAKHPVR